MALTPAQLKQLRQTVTLERNKLQVAIDISHSNQSRLARELGMGIGYVSDVCNGRFATITVTNAERFADHFGCSIADLFLRAKGARR